MRLNGKLHNLYLTALRDTEYKGKRIVGQDENVMVTVEVERRRVGKPIWLELEDSKKNKSWTRPDGILVGTVCSVS